MSDAEPTPAEVYDRMYEGDYRAERSGYEVARFHALADFIPRVAGASGARRVLDYGSGRGLQVALWEKVFPGAELTFADVSGTALRKLREAYPRHAPRAHQIVDDHVELPSAGFDAVVSIEVMEHVRHLDQYLAEIHRLLAPGGLYVWTAPCANRGSIEHLYSLCTRQIARTERGERRWAWEDPTHLRRLTTREASDALRRSGFEPPVFRYRAHFFSFACTRLLARAPRLAERLMLLDYALWRRLPNAASMICAVRKPAASAEGEPRSTPLAA